MYFDSDDLYELDEYLDQNNIPKDKICIIGSATLSLLGIRKHNDIDIVIHSSLNLDLSHHSFIDSVTSPWSTLCSDDELIINPKYHIIYNGYKFVVPELIYHKKVWHNRLKDINDVCELKDYANMHDDWDWDLIRELLPIKTRLQKFIIRVKNKFIFLNNKLRNYQRIHDNLIDSDCHQMVATNLLLSKQIINGTFNRFDVIVRYLAIESYLNDKYLGIALYKKMQDNRRGSAFKNPMKQFKYLITSFENYGYDISSAIIVNRDLQIIDGGHRLACALYFNSPFVAIKVNKRLSYSPYGIDWFQSNLFSSDEIALLNEQKDNLFLRNNLYFEVILWPSVAEYFDEIQIDISNKFQIFECTNYNNIKNFDEYVRNLYMIDDIKDWKVALKVKGFSIYKKDIRILKCYINDPKFRKKDNGYLISEKVEQLKNEIRIKYSNRVPNYFHDIIIHIGDNYQHTKKSSALIIEV